MKELISFSLKRRFFNSATALLNILLCCLVCCALFADKLIELVNPSILENQKIILQIDDTIEQALMENKIEGIEFIQDDRSHEEILKEMPKAYILYVEDTYKLASQYEIPSEVMNGIETMLSNLHQSLSLSEFLSLEEQEVFYQTLEIENIVLHENIQMDTGKQNLVFMMITSIYFTMLSFSTTVANEVIYEKSTRQLELILTSVNAKTHFLSKMAVGWLNIMIQTGALVIYGFVALILRIGYDQGRGLISLVNKLGLFVIEQDTILSFLTSLPLELDFMIKILFILFFLMIGILLLQMVLVVLSSFIANIEEAGNVQGPFYMILLGIYYFALSMNTPYQMSEGVGFVLSFFPFLNMLFMPCRLLIQNVSMIELLLSALSSTLCMWFILKKGPLVYQRGVLDYTSKGFLGVIKKTFVKEKNL